MDAQLARIAAKLQAAAAVPTNHSIFGADKHRFALNPPLADDDVAAFEREHRIRLPEEYRRFITTLGDGGAGPTYGLLPLADAYAEVSDSYPGHLAAASPFRPAVTYADDWWDQFHDQDRRRDPCQGTIAVVHHGCTSYTLLIVSGPARGRLVSIDHNGIPAPYLLEDPDFLSWSERWLDELAAGYDVTRIFEKIPGGESALLAIASSDPDDDRRARATWSLCTLPSLTTAGRAALAELIADPVTQVRAIALQTADRFHAPEAERPARHALNDSNAVVRAAAMRVLRTLKPADLTAVARRMLTDEDRDVIRHVVWTLKGSGDLTVADLAPLTASGDPQIRVLAVHHLREATGEGVDPLLDVALDDREPAVRWTAVQAIERREVRDLRPKLVKLLATETDQTVLVNLRRVVPALRQ